MSEIDDEANVLIITTAFYDINRTIVIQFALPMYVTVCMKYDGGGGGGGTKASCLTCPENETIGYCVQRGELEIEFFTVWTDVLRYIHVYSKM